MAHQELYEKLVELTHLDCGVYSVSKTTRFGIPVEIFNYRLVSPTTWLERPEALHARGIMFDVSYKDDVELMSWPMPKFFNWGENEQSIFPIYNDSIKYVEKKLDGSLISTYLDCYVSHYSIENSLRLKSKGSLDSDQARAAMLLLDTDEYKTFKDLLTELAESHLTVNMEYTSPTNRIVVMYPREQLTILNVVDNIGRTYVGDEAVELVRSVLSAVLKNGFNINGKHSSEHLVDEFKKRIVKLDTTEVDDIKSYFSHIDRSMDTAAAIKATRDAIAKIQQIDRHMEGYVLYFNDREHPVKVKTSWYSGMHKTRDSLIDDKSLFQAIVDNCADDLKALYVTDPIATKRINDFECAFLSTIRKNLKALEDAYIENRAYDRKSYALNVSTAFNNRGPELLKGLFGVAMTRYLKPDVDVVGDLELLFMKQFKNYIPS